MSQKPCDRTKIGAKPLLAEYVWNSPKQLVVSKQNRFWRFVSIFLVKQIWAKTLFSPNPSFLYQSWIKAKPVSVNCFFSRFDIPVFLNSTHPRKTFRFCRPTFSIASRHPRHNRKQYLGSLWTYHEQSMQSLLRLVERFSRSSKCHSYLVM